MKFREMIKENASVLMKEPIVKNDDETLGHWFNVKNPDTGRRYEIPMLNTLDPEYFFKYVEMMKIKEETPELFDKLMSWE